MITAGCLNILPTTIPVKYNIIPVTENHQTNYSPSILTTYTHLPAPSLFSSISSTLGLFDFTPYPMHLGFLFQRVCHLWPICVGQMCTLEAQKETKKRPNHRQAKRAWQIDRRKTWISRKQWGISSVQASKYPGELDDYPQNSWNNSGYWEEEDSAAFFGGNPSLMTSSFTQILAIVGKPLNLISVMVPLFFGPDAIYLQMQLFHVLCGIICWFHSGTPSL